jgi:hypothetical protein
MAAQTNVRPIPKEAHTRLGKLIPMLSSAHDGERAAAANAIGQLLKAYGLDFHDLTGAVLSSGMARPSSPPPTPQQPPRPKQRKDSETGEDWVTVNSDKVIERIEFMRAQCRFSAASEEFLDGLLERANIYGDVYFSPKMQKWFKDLERQAAQRRR